MVTFSSLKLVASKELAYQQWHGSSSDCCFRMKERGWWGDCGGGESVIELFLREAY